MSEQTDVIKHRIVYDAHASDLITALDMALHEISQLADEDVAAIADVAHFNLHSLSERLVNNELAHERAMAEGGWQAERWAPIKGWEGSYEISDWGHVRSLPRQVSTGRGQAPYWVHGGLLAQREQRPHGYYCVSLRNGADLHQSFSVHRLVAAAFVGNPDNKPSVNHKDSDRRNNHFANLEWCTQRENIHHMIAKGRKFPPEIGKRSPYAILSDEQVRLIRLRYAEGGISYEQLAHQYEMSKRSIQRCIRLETYSYVQ